MIYNYKHQKWDLIPYMAEVDEETYWYFVEVLPPIWGKIHPENLDIVKRTLDRPFGWFVQINEPYDHWDNKATYATIVYIKDNLGQTHYHYIHHQHNLGRPIHKFYDKDGVIRYPKRDIKPQLDQFVKDAKAGKVLCLSDLIGNAGM